ncbi:MAG: HAMP domain-containing protein [Kofleriaceae bacterium]|nr:HAMP domain-containing protein [Myxococcales bacterium]MCB9570925.1 HAMP domain-containing protein [Kofleriaceae bacterium]
MKVTPRITIATGLIVAVAVGAWAFFDLRGNALQRRRDLEREGRAVAYALRAGLEARPDASWRIDPDGASRDLGKAVAPWKVTVLPMDADDVDATDDQRRRLEIMRDAPKLTLTSTSHGLFAISAPLREPAPTIPDGVVVIGMVEVSRPIAVLDLAARDDLVQAILLLVLISGLATLAVGGLARSLMSRPVAKLLRGIDDVAKGDLSHVLLSERDDEIGALATRFNEMTFSLRESRAESSRQNQAKLDLEQRLAQTEKLATIGQLAAEIAHEVGTPLGVIGGRARSIQKKSTDREAVEKNSQIIAEQTTRITKIIQRLLDFARRKTGHVESAAVNLNELTLTTMELLGSQFAGAKVKTRLARAEGLPWVAGDADRLQQVLLNLLLNAVQAMPDGGAVRVETSSVTRQRPGLELAREQVFVCVEVADTGVGIPEDARDKIFEPFYTTKEGRGGTGLGLAVCSGIVKEHDGWIEVDDGAEGGTVFRVFLPATAGAGSGDKPERERSGFERAERPEPTEKLDRV